MAWDLFAGYSVFEFSNEFDATFGRGIAFYLVLHKPALDFELYHLQGTTNTSINDSVITQICEISWKFDKLRQRVVVEDEREFVAWGSPVCDRWLNVEIHSKMNKIQQIFYSLIRFCLPESRLNLICSVSHVSASRWACFWQEVLDNSHSHVVAQPFKLLVHILNVLEVPKHLRHESTIGQRQKLWVLEE